MVHIIVCLTKLTSNTTKRSWNNYFRVGWNSKTIIKKTKHTIIISQSSLVLSESDVKRNKATRIGISDSWSHGWLTQAVVTLNTLPCLLTKQINIHRFIQKQSKKVYSIHSRRTADTRTNRQNQVNWIFVCFFFVGLHKISDNNSIWQLIHSNHTIFKQYNLSITDVLFCSVFAYYGDFQWKFSIFISFSDQMECFCFLC